MLTLGCGAMLTFPPMGTRAGIHEHAHTTAWHVKLPLEITLLEPFVITIYLNMPKVVHCPSAAYFTLQTSAAHSGKQQQLELKFKFKHFLQSKTLILDFLDRMRRVNIQFLKAILFMFVIITFACRLVGI